MKRMGPIIGVVVVFILVLLLSGAFYTVREWDQVVITQFGKPIGEPKVKPGLKLKMPLIQKINRYEKRIMRWDGDPKEIPTRDKRFIYVDTTARWRIIDAQKFLEVLGNYSQAYAKLDDIIDAVLRDYVSANPLVELVRTTNEMPNQRFRKPSAWAGRKSPGRFWPRLPRLCPPSVWSWSMSASSGSIMWSKSGGRSTNGWYRKESARRPSFDQRERVKRQRFSV
ncbi:MAG: hypothetical protein JRJ16_17360 [Deltaproteobacteria bacterium]|nr:hypothetical protein [Deltaproteobacteria bacterium]